MTKKNQSATEQDYLAKQRAQEISQLGRPTNGYANVQEMQEAIRRKEEELHHLQLAHEETVHMLEQERKQKEEMESTPYLAELEEVKKQLSRKEEELTGVRELSRKHVDKIRVLQNDLDEATNSRDKLKSQLDSMGEDKQFLEEMLGHILTKSQKKWHRAKDSYKTNVAKAYALPTDIVMEYVEEDTAHMYERRYEERKERFRDGMKGMF